jgi:hypothetical protein
MRGHAASSRGVSSEPMEAKSDRIWVQYEESFDGAQSVKAP